MMKRTQAFIKFIALLIIISLTRCEYLHADETTDLRQEVALLKERLAAVEAKLARVEPHPLAPAATAASAEAAPGSITSFAREIQVHGFVDTSYIFNTNTPVPPNARTNNLRLFDSEANGFMLNMTQINFERPISKESPAGFRVDLDYGQDARLIHSNGLGNPQDEFDLQQAYAQFIVPHSLPGIYTLSFKVGKFATLFGAEVIESANNWNMSRSLLYTFAIPFTETGIRAYYRPFADVPLDSNIEIVNGWDQVTDLNKGKTVAAQINYTPISPLTLTIGGAAGPERANSNKDMREVIDFIATYNVTDKLTLKVNYDYGWERNGASAAAGNPVQKDATWDGVAAYARYNALDWWSVSGRGEYFHDRDAVRTLWVTNAAMPLADLDIWEFTLTNEFRLAKNFLVRCEYRYDKASGQVFTLDETTANYQNTISGEVIYYF